MRFNLIFTICPADRQEEIVEAAKAAGATGATLLSARGTGVKEAKTFFGLSLDRPQEAVIMLVERHLCPKIMKAIYDSGDMVKPGNGICFTLPVDTVMGLESQLLLLRKETEEYI
ncbi:MAG: P-II family nitrogen regulator [Nitrospinae bacterium]|nr:P-II family nitrogen regulator [Nitrospinota bacterium]